MVRLQGDEWKTVAQYIQSICGIQLDQNKGYLIESRLTHLVEAEGATSFGALAGMARADAGGRLERRIIDAITTGETSFFRDQAPFDLLRHKLIPDLIDARARRGALGLPIRIWSAACSTGQEMYSIAMALTDVLGRGKYDVRLLGTDISPHAVARASRGLYNAHEIDRGVSPAHLSRHFLREPDGWKVRDEIRGMVSFRTLNLLRDFSFLGQFDIVFCRNVAIYFNESDKTSLFTRIEKCLGPEGVLLIGSTESLTGICPGLEPRRHLRSVYYGRVVPTRPPSTPSLSATAVLASSCTPSEP
jgi:chemotaxis protein methyltransferase CheR